MRVAVDIAFYNKDVHYRNLMLEVFGLLADQNSEHQFVFLCNKEYEGFSVPHGNVMVAVIPGNFTNQLSVTWWYNVKLPFALRKYKADVLVASNGIAGFTISIPQVLILKDLAFIKGSNRRSTTGSSHSKKQVLRFLKKATTIVTHTMFVKNELIETFNFLPDKIIVAEITASQSYTPLDWQKKEEMKDQYAQGCEYFLLPADRCQSQDLLHVLKAFSFFKKRQKSNMKLLITDNTIARDKSFDEKLKSYKYKNDVCFINFAAHDWPMVIAGAYALVSPSLPGDFSVEILQAMQCKVPVITSAGGSNEEAAADAALFAKPGQPEDLADQMKLVYKDEQLRNKLIAQGSQRVKQFDPHTTTTVLWQAILQAVSK